ncbi:MAG: DUF460 domain-containing protein [archaeon]
MKKLLIAGIDPGTTLGYALLDLKGNVVKIRSSKQLDMSSLILEMIKEGRVIIVGTDRKKAPKFADKLASKIGARLIKPEEDLAVEQKRELTKGEEFGNEHEKDALASAIYAFKRIRSLLIKVDLYLKEHDKENIKNEVEEIVLRDYNVNISEAIAMVEQPEKQEEKKRKRNRTGKIKEEEYYEEEKEKLKDVREVERRLGMLKADMAKIVKKKMKKVIKIKDQKIDLLIRKIREQEEKLKEMEEHLEKMLELMKKAEENIILRKIKNLSLEEIEKHELGKVIYVEDPNIFSEKSAGKIRESVEIIISKKQMSAKVREKFKVIFINANKLNAYEENGIILINKEKLEKEKKKVDILKKVIDEYRETR